MCTYIWASLVAQMIKNPPAMWETRLRPLGWEDPLEKEWQPTPVFLPGESHGWRNLVAYSPQGHKELDTTERLNFHFHLLVEQGGVYTVATWIIFFGEVETQ